MFRLLVQLLLVVLFVLSGNGVAFAWDDQPDAEGMYDKYYCRPTHFPDWHQPQEWLNREYYLVRVIQGKGGPKLRNYEVAVYDQNNVLRHCNRSEAKFDDLCTLTIPGIEGDQFHFKVVYGDFEKPTIVDVPVTIGFTTNDIVGSRANPFLLEFPGQVYLSEMSDVMPENETGVKVTVERTIDADAWNTICIPFAIPAEKMNHAFGDGWQLGDFDGCDVLYEDDGETVRSMDVKFKQANAIEAHHPYIIKVREALTSFEVSDVNITALANDEEPSVDCDEYIMGKGKNKVTMYNRFIGNYTNGFLVPSQCLFLSGGKFWYSVGKTPMMAYRAYFDFYEVLPDTATSRISVTFEEDPTDIKEVNNGMPEANVIFDLQGRRVSSPRRGIYLRNGKKFLYH